MNTKLPLKDWCRSCKDREYGEYCFRCLYGSFREELVEQPKRFKEKQK